MTRWIEHDAATGPASPATDPLPAVGGSSARRPNVDWAAGSCIDRDDGTPQGNLIERLRILLADEPSTRGVSMVGGRSFMVNDKMVVSALKSGDLLVRVPGERHDELPPRPGAAQAEMGTDRSMGLGWIAVSEVSINDAGLSFWLRAALDYNLTEADR